MFLPGSRYEKAKTYNVTLRDGRTVTAVRMHVRAGTRLLGYHRRLEGQRLDLIAARYLKDATASWRLCDAANAISPDALAARTLIPVAEKAS